MRVIYPPVPTDCLYDDNDIDVRRFNSLVAYGTRLLEVGNVGGVGVWLPFVVLGVPAAGIRRSSGSSDLITYRLGYA